MHASLAITFIQSMRKQVFCRSSTLWGYLGFCQHTNALLPTIREDALGTTNIGAQGLFAAGVDIVKANFAKHGVDDPKLVQLIPGWCVQKAMLLCPKLPGSIVSLIQLEI